MGEDACAGLQFRVPVYTDDALRGELLVGLRNFSAGETARPLVFVVEPCLQPLPFGSSHPGIHCVPPFLSQIGGQQTDTGVEKDTPAASFAEFFHLSVDNVAFERVVQRIEEQRPVLCGRVPEYICLQLPVFRGAVCAAACQHNGKDR